MQQQQYITPIPNLTASIAACISLLVHFFLITGDLVFMGDLVPFEARDLCRFGTLAIYYPEKETSNMIQCAIQSQHVHVHTLKT